MLCKPPNSRSEARKRLAEFANRPLAQQNPQRSPAPQRLSAQSKVHSLLLTQNTQLTENHKGIRLAVDLPGVNGKDLDVSIENGVLAVRGSRTTLSADDKVCIKKFRFSRRYAIDTNKVDVSNVTAFLKNGVLIIQAPKKQARVRVPVQEPQAAMVQDVAVNVAQPATNSNAVTVPSEPAHVKDEESV